MGAVGIGGSGVGGVGIVGSGAYGGGAGGGMGSGSSGGGGMGGMGGMGSSGGGGGSGGRSSYAASRPHGYQHRLVLRATLNGHGGGCPVTSLDLCARQGLLASGGGDRGCFLWDARSGRLAHALSGHNAALVAVSIR